jgi:predicted nucleic acid-binding protein
MIVVDTNVVAYLLLSGPHTASAAQALRRDPEWAAPLLWRSELRNVLSLYLRQQTLTLEQANEIMNAAQELLDHREYNVVSWQVLRLAAASGASAYDCEFVALAEDLDVPFVTVDGRLVERFPRRAVALEAFSGA